MLQPELHRAYLGLGANLGDPARTIERAYAALASIGTITARSALYRSAPWGVTDQPAFMNSACCLETGHAPLALLDALKAIETDLGRVPGVRWGPRALDIDILLYDDLVLETPRLTIPHRWLHVRAFALLPLAEIGPDVQHPVLGQTVAALAAACDQTDVSRLAFPRDTAPVSPKNGML